MQNRSRNRRHDELVHPKYKMPHPRHLHRLPDRSANALITALLNQHRTRDPTVEVAVFVPDLCEVMAEPDQSEIGQTFGSR